MLCVFAVDRNALIRITVATTLKQSKEIFYLLDVQESLIRTVYPVSLRYDRRLGLY